MFNLTFFLLQILYQDVSHEAITSVEHLKKLLTFMSLLSKKKKILCLYFK